VLKLKVHVCDRGFIAPNQSVVLRLVDDGADVWLVLWLNESNAVDCSEVDLQENVVLVVFLDKSVFAGA
jgi:poly(3-hydroxyalkanoate) synthetase